MGRVSRGVVRGVVGGVCFVAVAVARVCGVQAAYASRRASKVRKAARCGRSGNVTVGSRSRTLPRSNRFGDGSCSVTTMNETACSCINIQLQPPTPRHPRQPKGSLQGEGNAEQRHTPLPTHHTAGGRERARELVGNVRMAGTCMGTGAW